MLIYTKPNYLLKNKKKKKMIDEIYVRIKPLKAKFSSHVTLLLLFFFDDNSKYTRNNNPILQSYEKQNDVNVSPDGK